VAGSNPVARSALVVLPSRRRAAGAAASHKRYSSVGSVSQRWGCDAWSHKLLELQAGGVIRVHTVAPGSLGAALGLAPKTELLAINGTPLEDFLDWEFLSADEHFMLHVRSPGGEE